MSFTKYFRGFGILIIVGLIILGIALWRTPDLDLWYTLTDRQYSQYRMQHVWVSIFGDAMEKGIKQLGGGKITDCGRVILGSNPRAATQCAMQAFSNKTAFKVRYDVQGIDSDVSLGLVFTPSGELYGVMFDGDPQGGGGTSIKRQRFSKTPCPKPYTVFESPKGRANCFKRDNTIHRSPMSPTFETY